MNIFLSPPFLDLKDRSEEFVKAVATLQEKDATESVIVIQGERGSPLEKEPILTGWEERRYGRNVLLIWQKEEVRSQETGDRGQRTESRIRGQRQQ